MFVLSFFWHNIERQVIIKGVAEKISENLSDGYFESRPDGSKLGAWASDQSEVVPSRKYLDERLNSFEKKFENKEITRPKYWGGYYCKTNKYGILARTDQIECMIELDILYKKILIGKLND